MSNQTDLERVAANNVTSFIAWRIFFNARYYYPVLAVLFLDLGLSLQQYAWLNVAWAAAIVLCEVPSGALADQFGRKKLVVFAAILMVLEMLVFAFSPTGNKTVLFFLFLVNRLISGVAEASASGADEALVYDSLKTAGQEDRWNSVLEKLSRWQAGSFFIVMVVGALLYDPAVWNFISSLIGHATHYTQHDTVRWPVYLTCFHALGALWAALRMTETRSPHESQTVRKAWLSVVSVGKWIAGTPAALFIILIGLSHDSIVRLFLTIGSSYYRLIQLPEMSFGIIGSSMALLGYLVAPISRKMIAWQRPLASFLILSLFTLAGLSGLCLAIPYAGVLFALMLGFGMSLTGFLVSWYFNKIVSSESRATALSFRGMAFNLAYGAAGIFFSFVGKTEHGEINPASLLWLPAYFLMIAGASYAYRYFYRKKFSPDEFQDTGA